MHEVRTFSLFFIFPNDHVRFRPHKHMNAPHFLNFAVKCSPKIKIRFQSDSFNHQDGGRIVERI